MWRTCVATVFGVTQSRSAIPRSVSPSAIRASTSRSRLVSSCLQVNAAGTEYNCTDYNHFAGGDIITAGRFSPLEKIDREAIVGGPNYAGMRGTFAVSWLARDFSKAQEAFTLHPSRCSRRSGAYLTTGALFGAASGGSARGSWR